MIKPTKIIGLILGIMLIFISCEKNESIYDNLNPEISFKTTLTEDFENGTKTAYAAASVNLGSGTWYFDDALLGNLSTDRKFDTKSIRLRNSGSATMLFDKEGGVGELSIYHAIFGSDGPSSWQLWMSLDGGYTWQMVGNTVTTSSVALTKQVFVIHKTGTVRFEIRKTSGGSYRINFDNLHITDYAENPGSSSDNDHMLLGNPSNAVDNAISENNFLMIKSQYFLSYSNSKLTPNWISWHLFSGDLGNVPRQNDFRADNTLPTNWYHVGSTEYSGSGFDRGHMCPSGDRKSTVENNSATFLMTNMIPQSPNNNRVTWVALEEYSRTLVRQGKELYIISGPYGKGGKGSNGYATTVGNGVVVPSYTWKILVVLDNANNDLCRITGSTRVIAVLMPNTQTVNSYSWGHYRVSIDELESLTGFDFMSNVSQSIQLTLEARVDSGPTS
jgi:endonuclease G, mitochondrial